MVFDPVIFCRVGLGRSLRQSLRATVTLIDQTSDLERRLETGCPTLAVVGPHVAEAQALNFCRQLHAYCPNTHIILLHPSAVDPLFRADAMAAAANACLPPEASEADLLLTVRAVLTGSQHFSDLVDLLILQPAPLTEREAEVLRLMAQNLTDLQIASQLVLSHATVRKHTHHVITKLRTHSRQQAIRRAHRLGLC
jgi:DNA-binding NarL/FixJ family response regulator